MLPEYFISCDWGTTNFRLRLVETESLQVLDEVKTDIGIKTLNEQCLSQKDESREAVFGDYLKRQIKNLEQKYSANLVVISGMASSTIGLEDLPYATMPMEGSGSTILWKEIKFSDDNSALLVSGVKTETNMMRGEEIQAIGLEDKLKPYGDGVLLLPGTHCKHLTYTKGQFTGMETFMTGELFELISQKSILAGSVQSEAMTDPHKTEFLNGVSLGLDGDLSKSLFLVRTHTVLHDMPKGENYFFLSGLLIGSELSYLKTYDGLLFLCAAEPVFSLYEIALKSFLNAKNIIPFGSSDIQLALLNGQRKIITQYVA